MKNSILKSRRALAGGAAALALSTLGVGLAAAPANAASESTWDRVAACESSGNWHIDTGNGYYGGLQFSLATWHGYGGSGSPADASKSEQIRIAEKVLAGQGWGAWPVCSVKAGVSGHEGAETTSSSSSSHHTTKHHEAKHHTTKHHTTRTTASRHVATVAVSSKRYTVKSGDTLAKIAAHLKVSGGWERLADANASTISNPNLIYPGQVLRLPA